MKMTDANMVFDTVGLPLAGTVEKVVVGGRDKFSLLGDAFVNIRQIGVIGWGSQGPAQAQNLKESLEDTDIKVVVGLRSSSTAFPKAEAAGFSLEDGTAGEMFKVISESDMVIILISDAGLAAEYKAIQTSMKAGATLGLSHGFLVGHMANVGTSFRKDINVVGVCPKGMGPSVRRLYVQGKEHNGAGINASYAVEQDYTGHAANHALGWAVAIGSPYIFPTTLTDEYRSDIFGERAILLGAVWGIAEALYADKVIGGLGKVESFAASAMSITGPISAAISKGGLCSIADALDDVQRHDFYETLNVTYQASLPLIREIYREVKSGREIASVIDQTSALAVDGWSKVDGSDMWRIGESARQGNIEVPLDPITSGVYLGVMMAQVDVLQENGHGWSEICNESIIEAVDSLNPYMAAKGVDFMVDNCSTTARLGGRKWGPRFAQMVTSNVLPELNGDAPLDWFDNHPVHEALSACMKLRPLVSIAVE